MCDVQYDQMSLVDNLDAELQVIGLVATQYFKKTLISILASANEKSSR